MDYLGIALVVLGAALAAGLAGIGSAIGVGIAGEVGAGVMTEDPENSVLSLCFRLCPALRAFTACWIAFFAMLKVGLVGGSAVSCDWVHGLAIMFACLPIALGGWISAISGKTSAACIQMIAKQPGEAGKAVILPCNG